MLRAAFFGGLFTWVRDGPQGAPGSVDSCGVSKAFEESRHLCVAASVALDFKLGDPPVMPDNRYECQVLGRRVWRQLHFSVTTTRIAAHYAAAGSVAARVFDFAPAALAR
jgi:hypothetical protein